MLDKGDIQFLPFTHTGELKPIGLKSLENRSRPQYRQPENFTPPRPFVNGVRDRNVRFPRIGELVLIRLPFDISGPASIISGSAGYSYNPCIVLGVFVRTYTWEMNVYVCCTYGGEPDAVSYVSSLLPTDRNQLLPLPYHLPLYTPPGFGTPLSFRNVL